MERRTVGIVVAIVLVAAAAAGVAFAFFVPAQNGPDCTLPPPTNATNGQWYTLASCPSTVTLAAHSYRVYPVVRLSDAEIVIGQYMANVSVGAYLLNCTELTALQQSPHPTAPPPSYLWSCGSDKTVCNLTIRIPPSPTQTYLVIENLNSGPAAVSWTKTLSIFYTPT